jgi:hypothetical protein
MGTEDQGFDSTHEDLLDLRLCEENILLTFPLWNWKKWKGGPGTNFPCSSRIKKNPGGLYENAKPQ